MLKTLLHGQLQLGAAQAAIAALAALLVILAASRRGIHLGRELAVAMARGIVQIIAVGSILLLLLRGPSWTSVFLLIAMMIAAGATSCCWIDSTWSRWSAMSGDTTTVDPGMSRAAIW